MRIHILVITLLLSPLSFADFVWDEGGRSGLRTIKKLVKAQGLKVFWWNIRYGSLSKNEELDQNLVELVHKVNPDVIALGEFKKSSLTLKTLEFLNQKYPYQNFIPYGQPTRQIGIQVFSRKPFTPRRAVYLDWTPLGITADEERIYRSEWEVIGRRIRQHTNWAFPYQVLDFHGYSLIPIHLAQPWRVVQAKDGSGSALRQLIFRDDNPLGYQVNRLKLHLENDFKSNQPYFLFGDFNIPRKVTMVKPKIYKNLKKGLHEIFRDGAKTYPAKSAPDYKKGPFKYQRVKIDMALTNTREKKSRQGVLTLKGSDHYPILFVLQDL